MTLASCNDFNITKSEGHVESAFRLVNHAANLTPMRDGFATELGFDYVLGGQERQHQEKKRHRIAPAISKLVNRRMPLDGLSGNRRARLLLTNPRDQDAATRGKVSNPASERELGKLTVT